MNKIMHINSMPCGSTGKIMFGIGDVSKNNNIESYFAFPEFDAKAPKEKENIIIIGNKFGSTISHIMGRLTGLNDCYSWFSTQKLIKKIEKIQPDILHLHNLHNCYLNISALFNYIKKKNIKVVWTLHDCWAFTAKCPYFELVQCQKWKIQCNNCVQLQEYPKSYIDNSCKLYNIKKSAFTNVSSLTLVTPSKWLSNLVKESFLQGYNLKIINNGIDLNIFKPTNSSLRNDLKLEKKYVILGVAQKWSNRKGLDIFVELYSVLPKDEFSIVLIGISEQMRNKLPQGIIALNKTENQVKLAEYYSMADVFLNPTREEVFGLVNIEALACGTPVVTFDTGGSPECLDNLSGIVLEEKNVKSVKTVLMSMKEGQISLKREDCVLRAQEFNEQLKYKEYVELYCNVLGQKD